MTFTNKETTFIFVTVTGEDNHDISNDISLININLVISSSNGSTPIFLLRSSERVSRQYLQLRTNGFHLPSALKSMRIYFSGQSFEVLHNTTELYALRIGPIFMFHTSFTFCFKSSNRVSKFLRIFIFQIMLTGSLMDDLDLGGNKFYLGRKALKQVDIRLRTINSGFGIGITVDIWMDI